VHLSLTWPFTRGVHLFFGSVVASVFSVLLGIFGRCGCQCVQCFIRGIFDAVVASVSSVLLAGVVCCSEDDSQLIERVASEFNQLQFYVTQSQGHPLVESIRGVSHTTDIFIIFAII